jgi:Fe-S oxidoreductase
MSSAYFVAHGDVPATESFARTSLACTGCHACRDMCDHKNDVAGTLFAARAAEAALGILPEPAMRVARGFRAQADSVGQAVRALGVSTSAVRADADTALLVGCAYLRAARPEAEAAVRAATSLTGEPVALVSECCGLPLLHAGDARGFAAQAEKLSAAVERHRRVLVVDAGCAAALRLHYGQAGVRGGVSAGATLLVELAATELGKLRELPGAAGRTVRYHDPCQLGRGLGVYDAPRRVLAHVTGRAPSEFVAHGPGAACSGGGGLLPVTMPETSREIARARQAEHERAGGGEIVTACASSLLSLRKAGPAAVSDLVTWIADAAARTSP